ncbi:protein serine/threonine phosphatase 2C [Aspergillus pseudodeflectus]|uniref:Protein serine/threonine phosphatase 2C n=1 Tax=Aspergillus pseudodeflectus TaxID=176178 RepID=A0ABR4K2U1_9EURO
MFKFIPRSLQTRPCRVPPLPTNGFRSQGTKHYSTNRPLQHPSSRSIKYTAITTGLISSTGLWWLITSKSTPEDSVPSLDPGTTPLPGTGLSPEQVTAILSRDAYSYIVRTIPGVDRYDGAQVASNSPCEDQFVHGQFPSPIKFPSSHDSSHWNGNESHWMAWGVFDGHLGPQTADVLARDLLGSVSRRLRALQPLNKGARIIDEAIQRAISRAFVDLDEEIFTTALSAAEPSNTEPLATKIRKMQPAFAGSCALLTLFDPETSTLHVACTGDSRAVLAQQSADGTWTATPLSTDQTGSNEAEISRVNGEHPGESSIVQGGRVLGLMVSRAFGDGQWKWPVKVQQELQTRFGGPGLLNPKYQVQTPPYITAEPVVTSTKLEPGRASVLILATDGLWDMVSSQQASELVGVWLDAQFTGRKEGRVDRGKRVEGLFDFGQFAKGVTWRFAEERTTVQDENAAVHLMRNAFGGSHHELIAGRLAFEAPHSRRVRDDMTVQVVFFNTGNLVGSKDTTRDGDADRK